MEKHHETKDLSLKNASRDVWLVKMPKYVSDSMRNAVPGSEIGKLKMDLNSKGLKEATFNFNAFQFSESQQKLPTEHKFNIRRHLKEPKDNPSLYLLSVNMLPMDISDSLHTTQTMMEDRVEIEGKVVHRCDCQPVFNKEYIALNKDRLKLDNENDSKKSMILIQPVNNFKPKSNHDNNIAYEAKKKVEGNKTRDDKEKVMDVLFSAFEKFQYYSIKDLVRITNQPITYLKQILKDMCNYNMRAPHKATWELKPEYRYYGKDKK